MDSLSEALSGCYRPLHTDAPLEDDPAKSQLNVILSKLSARRFFALTP
jgi:hypothetical protein